MARPAAHRRRRRGRFRDGCSGGGDRQDGRWLGLAGGGCRGPLRRRRSVFSAENYVRNRSQRLRFLRLLHDIWDFAYLVLPQAEPAGAYTQLSAIRTEWKTAGG